MKSPRALAITTLVLLFALPGTAYATETAVEAVPYWLSVVTGAVGLITAAVLMLDAALLRRVSEGSIIAENIVYMMTSVVCLAFSMLLRWAAVFADDATIVEQASFGADLLVTAGMALLAVYVYKVRRAMAGYLRAATSSAEDQSDSGDDDGGAEE